MYRYLIYVISFFGLCTPGVFAQDLPPGPLRIVAPFPPGGLTDLLARSISAELGKSLDRNVIVENRPGAGGNIGADVVAEGTPDGRTLLLTSASPLTINQYLYRQMPFDPEKSFAAVIKLADMSQLLAVHPKRVGSLKEFLSKGRNEADPYRMGSAGTGSVAHLALEMFMQITGVRTVHVPYKGAGPAAQDLLGAQIDGIFTNPPTVISHVEAGRLKALAVAGRTRLDALPNVPVFSEAGVPGFEASAWFGMVAPADTPLPVIQKLNRAIGDILRMPSMQDQFKKMGAQLSPSTSQEFADYIRTERTKWGKVIRAAGIKMQ